MEPESAKTLVRVLGALHLAFGIIAVLVALVGGAFTRFMGMQGMVIAGALFGLIVALVFLYAVFAVVVGIGLIRLEAWARIPGIVLGAISLFSIPIGTALGVLDIYFFGFDKDVRKIFKKK